MLIIFDTFFLLFLAHVRLFGIDVYMENLCDRFDDLFLAPGCVSVFILNPLLSGTVWFACCIVLKTFKPVCSHCKDNEHMFFIQRLATLH